MCREERTTVGSKPKEEHTQQWISISSQRGASHDNYGSGRDEMTLSGWVIFLVQKLSQPASEHRSNAFIMCSDFNLIASQSFCRLGARIKTIRSG